MAINSAGQSRGKDGEKAGSRESHDCVAVDPLWVGGGHMAVGLLAHGHAGMIAAMSGVKANVTYEHEGGGIQIGSHDHLRLPPPPPVSPTGPSPNKAGMTTGWRVGVPWCGRPRSNSCPHFCLFGESPLGEGVGATNVQVP